MSHTVVGRQRRTPKKRKKQADTPGLTKEAIVDAALKLIDTADLESFSMRNLAKELGVYPTAIYWHIPSRNAVIAEVITQVLCDIVPTDEPDWKLWLKKLFRNYRQAIRAHPNVAPLIGVQLVSNASVDLNMIESILETLSKAGITDADLPATYNAVIAAMVGYTTQEFAMVPKEEAEDWANSMQTIVGSVDGGQFPLLARNIDAFSNKAFILRWQNGAESPLDPGFETFIDAVVLGLEARLAR
ncbi:TetR/AcrR family transcriptional regulator [Labrenzia sp. DG1229]|uniref:TetR/AcrR family transcriptional regulator n=1 Tax=Labrenzia sp. DG1229 TaxID=681847 RepID=UPI00048E4D52|nr:TetR/AcrR family transcriptional regulator [Labrenzia sp. DG1229]